MFIDWKMLSIRFLTGVLLGLMTVQVLAQVDYDPFERTTGNSDNPGVYERLYPDVEVTDYGNGITETYNWDTNEYQDVEIINDYGHEVEVYNYDTGEYQVIDTCC
jgi:hypothetical protein